MEYIEISTERAKELGLMISYFSDAKSYPVSFNATRFEATCFGFLCELLIEDNGGCWYKENLI